MFLMDSLILSPRRRFEKRDHSLSALKMGIIFFVKLFSMSSAKAMP
jgi:hypothetical protein